MLRDTFELYGDVGGLTFGEELSLSFSENGMVSETETTSMRKQVQKIVKKNVRSLKRRPFCSIPLDILQVAVASVEEYRRALAHLGVSPT